MTDIIIGAATGLCTALLTSIAFAIVRRFRFTTKNDECIEEIKKSLAELAEAQKVQFKLLLPLLIKAKSGKTNGELDEAIHLYNEYMVNK